MTNAVTTTAKMKTNAKTETCSITSNTTPPTPTRRVKFGQLLRCSDPDFLSPLLSPPRQSSDNNSRHSSSSNASDPPQSPSTSGTSPRFSFTSEADDVAGISGSPYYGYATSLSPWNPSASSSPYINSPWIKLSPLPHRRPSPESESIYHTRGRNCLIGSLMREEGHVYSMAVHNGMLYTGSESKNIRVWKNFSDAGGFKSGSGLVKAIVVSSKDGRVFTGHPDGKIRIWTRNGKRVGTLPRLGELLKSSMNPKSYVEVRRHHKVPKVKHFDAVSCLALNEESGLLYSGSWDKTIKVWRISDGKCLETIESAHDDAVNAVVVGFGGLVFSGSADGTVRVWRRELQGNETKHFEVRTLLKQESAVTSLAVVDDVMYCGSSDGLVNFWEREEKLKEELVYGGVLRGHRMAVLCLGAVGSLVFSGSADKTICVWRREKDGSGAHSILAVLAGHDGPVKCLAVEEDFEDDDNNNNTKEKKYDMAAREKDYNIARESSFAVWGDQQNDEFEEEEEKPARQWIVYSGSLDKSIRIWRVAEDAPGGSFSM